MAAPILSAYSEGFPSIYNNIEDIFNSFEKCSTVLTRKVRYIYIYIYINLFKKLFLRLLEKLPISFKTLNMVKVDIK